MQRAKRNPNRRLVPLLHVEREAAHVFSVMFNEQRRRIDERASTVLAVRRHDQADYERRLCCDEAR